eukprot:COSAG02_NODE_12946_length_1468_cov_2.499635_2_plen_286_part_00
MLFCMLALFAAHLQALMLTYSITLILQNDDDDAFANEIFPREGYGWFICAIYVFVLPLPTVVTFWRGTQGKEQNLDENYGIGGLYDNPLAVADGTTEVGNFDAETEVGTAALSTLAKLSRENKALQEQVEMLMKNSSTPPQQAPATKGESDPVSASQPAQTLTREPHEQHLEIKKMAMDESLSEEVRADAQQKLDAVVTNQALQAKAIADKQHEEQISALRLSSLANKARFKQHLVATMKKNGQEDLATWLATNRLLHHEATILAITGQCVNNTHPTCELRNSAT